MIRRPTQQEYNQHRQLHYGGSRLSGIILGGQDGLVNVLGVILGVAAAAADIRLVIVAGLAATFAESVSMAAVAYTSAMAQHDYYHGEMEREKRHIQKFAHIEREEIRRIFQEKGFEGDLLETIVDRITNDEQRWIDVMMAEEFHLTHVDRRQALGSAAVVGLSALVGSLIPLIPFFLFPVPVGILASVLLAGLTLFAVGVYQSQVMGIGRWYRSGLKLVIIGLMAAMAGYIIGLIFRPPSA